MLYLSYLVPFIIIEVFIHEILQASRNSVSTNEEGWAMSLKASARTKRSLEALTKLRGWIQKDGLEANAKDVVKIWEGLSALGTALCC